MGAERDQHHHYLLTCGKTRERGLVLAPEQGCRQRVSGESGCSGVWSHAWRRYLGEGWGCGLGEQGTVLTALRLASLQVMSQVGESMARAHVWLQDQRLFGHWLFPLKFCQVWRTPERDLGCFTGPFLRSQKACCSPSHPAGPRKQEALSTECRLAPATRAWADKPGSLLALQWACLGQWRPCLTRKRSVQPP